MLRRHWVVFKLVINVVSTIVLLLYMRTFNELADVAADQRAELDMVRSASPLLHAAAALLLLITATVLAVYKPRGLTAYGRKRAARVRS